MLGDAVKVLKSFVNNFLILLKASEVTLHTNQSTREKSGFMGHTHRNTKLHFVWPCGILTK